MSAALINAMNRLESSARQNRHGTDNKLTDDAASKKHKSHVLAKYSEISDEELDYGEEVGTPDNGLFHNTNSQDIDDREKKVRELQQEVNARSASSLSKSSLCQSIVGTQEATGEKQDRCQHPKAEGRGQKEESSTANTKARTATLIGMCSLVFSRFPLRSDLLLSNNENRNKIRYFHSRSIVASAYVHLILNRTN